MKGKEIKMIWYDWYDELTKFENIVMRIKNILLVATRTTGCIKINLN